MKKNDRWKAVRRGEKYCAPACGRGCTFAEFKKAHDDANRLMAQLVHEPTDVSKAMWKARVWENLGWHFSITKGAVTVNGNSERSFSAVFNLAGPWGGNAYEYAASPELAIRRLMKRIRKELKPMVDLHERLQEAA